MNSLRGREKKNKQSMKRSVKNNSRNFHLFLNIVLRTVVEEFGNAIGMGSRPRPQSGAVTSQHQTQQHLSLVTHLPPPGSAVCIYMCVLICYW